MGTTINPTTKLLSVPDIAEAVGVRLDRLRKLLSRRPDLSALLTPVATMKVLDATRLDEFRAMLKAS